MALSDPALAALQKLFISFPTRKVSEDALRVYLEHLADLPLWLLEQTVDQALQTSRYLPSIAELRQIAAQLSGATRFDQLPRQLVDRLAAEAQRLEDLFFQTGALDPAAWQRLSEAFAAADRPHRAEYTLEKLRRLQVVAQARASKAPRASRP